MSNVISSNDLDLAGMDHKAKIADMINGNEREWPMEWDRKFDSVLNVPIPTIDASKHDKVIWINKKGKEVEYSVSEVWKAVIEDCPNVIWHNHV